MNEPLDIGYAQFVAEESGSVVITWGGSAWSCPFDELRQRASNSDHIARQVMAAMRPGETITQWIARMARESATRTANERALSIALDYMEQVVAERDEYVCQMTNQFRITFAITTIITIAMVGVLHMMSWV